jgi:hypothetical protein
MRVAVLVWASLQNSVHRFDSGRRLSTKARELRRPGVGYVARGGFEVPCRLPVQTLWNLTGEGAPEGMRALYRALRLTR